VSVALELSAAEHEFPADCRALRAQL
jgi:hypothetical protein